MFYTAGNAGNGNNPQPDGIILGAGAQFIPIEREREQKQDPGLPTPLASFSVTLLGDTADKIGKDDNFRGMTVFNNVLYYTKGSGGNGVNTVYFVDTTGTACPKGVGLPAPGAQLPTAPLSYDPATLTTTGLPSNMCILAGFPIDSREVRDGRQLSLRPLVCRREHLVCCGRRRWLHRWHRSLHPCSGADHRRPAEVGVQCKHQDLADGVCAQERPWHRHALHGGKLPTGNNPATKLPWAPATDGLRNITGLVGPDGLVAIWAVTSTVSGNGDQGADPNRLFVVVDYAPNTDASVAAGFPFLKCGTLNSAKSFVGFR